VAEHQALPEDQELHPWGYKSEMPDGLPTFHKHSEFGWGVHRRYVLYDGRPATELLAVHRTEKDALEHQDRILIAVRNSN
jgi:hypothetical protein